MIKKIINKEIINNIDIFVIEKDVSTVITADLNYNGTNINEILKNNKEFKNLEKKYTGYYFFIPNHNKAGVNVSMVYGNLYTLDNTTIDSENKQIYNGWIKINENGNILIKSYNNGLFGINMINDENNYGETEIKLSGKYKPIILIEYNKYDDSNITFHLISPLGKIISDNMKIGEINDFIKHKLGEYFVNQGKMVNINKEIEGFFKKKAVIKIKTCYNTINENAPYCINHYKNKIEI